MHSAMVGGRADSADKNMEDIARNDVQKGKKVADMMHGKPPSILHPNPTPEALNSGAC